MANGTTPSFLSYSSSVAFILCQILRDRWRPAGGYCQSWWIRGTPFGNTPMRPYPPEELHRQIIVLHEQAIASASPGDDASCAELPASIWRPWRVSPLAYRTL